MSRQRKRGDFKEMFVLVLFVIILVIIIGYVLMTKVKTLV